MLGLAFFLLYIIVWVAYLNAAFLPPVASGLSASFCRHCPSNVSLRFDSGYATYKDSAFLCNTGLILSIIKKNLFCFETFLQNRLVDCEKRHTFASAFREQPDEHQKKEFFEKLRYRDEERVAFRFACWPLVIQAIRCGPKACGKFRGSGGPLLWDKAFRQRNRPFGLYVR